MNKGFKIGDYVKEKPIFNYRESVSGQIYDILFGIIENESIIMITDSDGKIYSNFFYMFEFDKEKIRKYG